MNVNSYDYIIVGAGSAGCVVAAQLIQQTSARVLLIEAGGSDNHLFIKMPAGVAKIIEKKVGPIKQNLNLMPIIAKCKSHKVKFSAAAVQLME